jgi:hypothetical protein
VTVNELVKLLFLTPASSTSLAQRGGRQNESQHDAEYSQEQNTTIVM